MTRLLVLGVLACMGCAPAEPDAAIAQLQRQIRVMHAEAERVQRVIRSAQQGCQAIRSLPEPYWLMNCLEIERAPSALTVALIERR